LLIALTSSEEYKNLDLIWQSLNEEHGTNAAEMDSGAGDMHSSLPKFRLKTLSLYSSS